MKRSIQAAIGAVVVLAALLVAPVAANALPPTCTGAWSGWLTTFSTPHWGQFQWCRVQDNNLYFWQFQVQDIYTDGYSVHLEACSDNSPGNPCTDGNGNWLGQYGLIIYDGPNDGCPQSSGSVETTPWPALSAFTPGLGQSYTSIKLVRGRCEGGTYQNVASVSYTINN